MGTFFAAGHFQAEIDLWRGATMKVARVNSLDSQKTGGKSPKRVDDPNAQIATKLRTFYHSVQDETLPQRFLDLLEKLDAVENSVQRAE